MVDMSKLIQVFDGSWVPVGLIQRITAYDAVRDEQPEVRVVIAEGKYYGYNYPTLDKARAAAMDIALRANKLLP
jgi:hypothetical protein